MDRARQGLEDERFCKARHAFQQDVAVANQPHEEAIHERMLPDNDAGNFIAERLDPAGAFPHGVSDRLNVGGRPAWECILPRRTRRRSFRVEAGRFGCLRSRRGEEVVISLNMRFVLVCVRLMALFVMRLHRPRCGGADLSCGLHT